jgi:hypothetical protein
VERHGELGAVRDGVRGAERDGERGAERDGERGPGAERTMESGDCIELSLQDKINAPSFLVLLFVGANYSHSLAFLSPAATRSQPLFNMCHKL